MIKIQEKTGLSKKAAFGVTVFIVNVCGTITFLTSGLYLATSIAKVGMDGCWFCLYTVYIVCKYDS